MARIRIGTTVLGVPLHLISSYKVRGESRKEESKGLECTIIPFMQNNLSFQSSYLGMISLGLGVKDSLQEVGIGHVVAELPPVGGSPVPQGLRRLLDGLLVPDVEPQAGVGVLLQESAGGAPGPDGLDDAAGDGHLVPLVGADVQLLFGYVIHRKTR